MEQTKEIKSPEQNSKSDIKKEAEKSGVERAYYQGTPDFSNRRPSKIRQQFNRGMTIFIVIAAGILFYFALLRLPYISDVIKKIINVLKPVLYGCVIAYLLNPIVKKIDQYLIPVLKKYVKTPGRAEKISRGLGVFISIILLLLLIVLLLNMLIPELYSSIRSLVITLPSQFNHALNTLNSIEFNDNTTTSFIRYALEEGSNMVTNWLRNDLMSQVNSMMSNLTVGVVNVISELFYMVIGLIVSIYLLFSKELFARQSKKMVYSIFSTDHANLILHLTTKSNGIFGGFIIGKIIDSAIIGVICFIGLSLLKMPYVMLVSVIVGVTNVIPFFGPYIGAIPSAVLIMLDNPMKGLYFLIFILVVQQFDGNVLGPKILGNSTGLSAFWVIVAILLGGGLFGFVGMLIGVPAFAVIYYIVDMILDHRLEKKGLPVKSDYYDEFSYVDSKGRYVHSDEIKKETKEK